MNKKTLVAITLAVVFTLALAAPALAFPPIPYTTGDLSQTISYEFEGQISFKKQAGHLCNTGAEMKQVISGTGKLEKSSEIYMKAYFLDVMDSNSFVTAPDAVKNLEVITAIELCAPAKHVFTAEAFEYGQLGPLLTLAGFKPGDPIPTPIGYDPESGGWADPDWANLGVAKPLTKQIWATSVSADPGHMGNYTAGFKAAYGPYVDAVDDEAWWFVNADDNWIPGFKGAFDGLIDTVKVGEDYVGNYFGIEQFVYTSSGVTKRFTEISSPWSHAYFTNDLTITGMASITEAFTMANLPEGTAATTDWWDLF